MTDRSVVYRLRADVAQFRAEMATAAASVKDAGDKMTATNKQGATFRQGLTTVGRAAGLVGLAAGAGLAVVVHAAANFDQAMSNVQAATHETSSNMDLLRQAAISAGQATKYSASEAAGGIEALAKAGVSTKDILAGGLKGALSLAAAGNQSVADAAETAASAMTQFGLAGKDIPHIADLLAAGAGKAQGEVSDLAMALNQTGLVAAQTGLTINETTAGLSAFASAGLIGSDAGTSFKTMLLRLTPTSLKAKTLMDDLGISAYDSQGSFIGLAKFAGVLQDKLGGMSDQQRNATLQTIFGQDAIRAANVLYKQGADGIQQWTKSVNDQGYAAQTAAIKMDNLSGDLEQLRGSLETALIGTGEGAQGPLRSLVQTLTQVVNAYIGLPPAAKSAASGLLGVTAVAGGGLFVFSKVVQGAADTRLALERLGVSSGTAAGRLKLLGGALGVAGAAIVGFQALDAVIRSMDKAAPSVDHLTRSLLKLSDAQDAESVSEVTSQLGNLRDSIQQLSDPGIESDLLGAYDKVPLVGSAFANFASMVGSAQGPLDDVRQNSREATTELDALDQALAGMVAGGSADVAAQTFDKLAETYGLTAAEQTKLKALLPQYADALDAAANSATLAGHKTKGLGDDMAGAAQQTTKMDKALLASRKAADQTAQGFITLGKGISDNKVSLQGWIKQLQNEADALKNFRINAETAAKKGLDEGLTAALEKAGPTGALRMRQLANASKSEIAKANQAWEAGQRQIKLYTDAVGGVPKTAGTKLTVDTGTAIAGVRTLQYAIDHLHGNTVILRTTGGHATAGQAEGGTVAGSRFPYGDKVLTMLAPGEEVISNRYGQADRFRADRASGRIPHYAAGGTVGSSPIHDHISADEHHIHDLQKSIDRLTKTVDDEKRSRDALAQKEQALAQTVTDSLRSDLFTAASPWMSAGGPDATLRSDIRDARAYNKALHTLHRKGLRGGAFETLAASGNLQAVQAEAGLSRHQIGRYEHLFNVRQRLTSATGQYAGDVRFGRQLDKANAILDHSRAHLHHLNEQMKHLNQEVAHLRKEAAQNAKKTGDAVGDKINGTSSKAKRRVSP
jgi:TP901 family phage tail tape measure protein